MKKIVFLLFIGCCWGGVRSVQASDIINPVSAGGRFDGKRFYVLKANGDTDYNVYQYTPKTKAELIDLLDEKTPLGVWNVHSLISL